MKVEKTIVIDTDECSRLIVEFRDDTVVISTEAAVNGPDSWSRTGLLFVEPRNVPKFIRALRDKP